MEQEDLSGIDLRSLGARLRQAREELSWTQERVAAHLGVARTTLVALEKGERRIRAEELVELASLYGRRLSSFLQRGSPVEGFAVQLRGALPPSTPIAAELLPRIQEFQDLCEDYRRLEDLRKAPLRQRYPPPSHIEKLDPLHAAEDVAAEERRRLRLGDGPLLNLRDTLESDIGLRIFLL